ncbi:MAG: translation initiation factor IF-2 [Verrucomicrobiota bacterium]
MPAKSKSTSHSGPDSSATLARKTVARPATATAGTESAPPLEVKKADTLDLIGEKPKRNRVKPGTVPAAEPEPAPAPAPIVKKEVLSLIDDDKPKVRRRPAGISPIVPLSGKPAPLPEPAAEVEPEPAPVTVNLTPPVPEAAPTVEDAEPDDPRVISIKPPIIVRDLADRMGLKVFVLIKDLMLLDIFANPGVSIEPDIAAKICEKHDFIFEREKREKGGGVHKVEEIIQAPVAPVEEPEETLKPRAPIITFMGHVDHGKTSLIDAIRQSRVAAGEAGGITQGVAAYSIDYKDQKVTILDTPGHAAFTAMRARGAMITDIVVLVIAANDGIMPQTKEAIAHAKAAKVKIVVAMNKCDLPGADFDKVKRQLQENDLSPEDWGGEIGVVAVSATKKIGIDELLERALLEAEILELRANPKAACRAMVIESRIEPGRGPTATIIPQTGTLRIGTSFICGPHYGKVKSMVDDRGRPVKEAGPAMPVEVTGFSSIPNVGDELVEMDNERDAKKLSDERTADLRAGKLAAPKRASLESLFQDMKGSERKSLRLILKTDVQGSLEAIIGQLKEIKSDKVSIDFVLSAVGPITESDILLSSASNAVVVGFNTKVEPKAVKAAKAEGVQVKLYSIIYELLDQMEEAMLGLLDPLTREKVIGHAQVKQVFKIQRGRAGGCVVTDGKLVRNARARVLRGRQPVYDGGFQTLRRFTDDVAEVRNGMECGIRLGDFNDYEVNDIIECYELEKIAQTL